eukprot:758797-Hanusia_phi.AAC.7
MRYQRAGGLVCIRRICGMIAAGSGDVTGAEALVCFTGWVAGREARRGRVRLVGCEDGFDGVGPE